MLSWPTWHWTRQPTEDDQMDNWQKAELNAPLNQSGPLPRNVSTLQYIPDVRHANYARQMDGTFALRFISRDDETSLMAYQDDVAGGKLPVVVAGETPESVAARGKAAAEQSQAILDKVNAEESAERESKRQTEHAKALADVDRQFAPQ